MIARHNKIPRAITGSHPCKLVSDNCQHAVESVADKVGDGEADQSHCLGGLGTLIRLARIDLGILITADTEGLCLPDYDSVKIARNCKSHWAIGRIQYTHPDETGFLIYLKSSLTWDEPNDIHQYRNSNPAFPHEPTSDQLFSIEQFESYRILGQHVTEQMIADLKQYCGGDEMPISLDTKTLFDVLEKAPEKLSSQIHK